MFMRLSPEVRLGPDRFLDAKVVGHRAANNEAARRIFTLRLTIATGKQPPKSLASG
jgi:hypothetical protein